MASRTTWVSLAASLTISLSISANGATVDTHVEGIPASNSLGAEDIWHNPDFRGGVVNGGATARSNW
jgi:hypothetical protein